MYTPQSNIAYTPQETKQYIRFYRKNPRAFSHDQVRSLKQHAQHYNISVDEDELDNTFSPLRAIRSAGEGFLSGFTTINIGDQPKNQYEGIARSIGQLAGFVGYLPSKPISAASKLMGGVGWMDRTAGVLKAAKGSSIPMYGAGQAEALAGIAAKKLLVKGTASKVNAVKSVSSFLSKEIPTDMLKGAFHMGTASAISSWQGGVKEMANAFGHGAVTGTVFRGVGNVESGLGETIDRGLRMTAMSLHSGLPSTMHGATTEEQVYEYLLGAYFGYKEGPAYKRNAGRYVNDLIKAGKDASTAGTGVGFDQLSTKAKAEVPLIVNKIFGLTDRRNSMIEQIAGKFKIPLIRAEEVYNEYRAVAEMKHEVMQKTGDEVVAEGIAARLKKGEKNLIPNLTELQAYNDVEGIENLTSGVDRYVKQHTKYWSANPEATAGELRQRALDVGIKLQHTYEKVVDEQKKNGRIVKYSTDGKAKPEDVGYTSLSDYVSDFLVDQYGEEPFKPDSDKGKIWTQKGIYANGKHNKRMINMFVGYGRRGPEGDFSNSIEGTEFEIGDGSRMFNKLGNQIGVTSPPEFMDEIFNTAEKRWMENGGGYEKGDKRPQGTVYLDSVVVSRYGKVKEVNAYDLNSEERAVVFGEMDKAGYIYEGGRGDAQTMRFVPIHPEIRYGVGNNAKRLMKMFGGVENIHEKQLRGFSEFAKSRGKDVLGLMPSQIKTVRGQRNYLNKVMDKFPGVKAAYDKAIVSNALYLKDMAGVGSLKEYFKADGFIKNAIEYNKRQAIYNTAGYTGDMNLAKGEFYEHEGVPVLRVLRVFDESVGVDQKKLHKGSSVFDYMEATDGGTLQTEETGKALAYITGQSFEGKHKANVRFLGKEGRILQKDMFHLPPKGMNKFMTNSGIDLIVRESGTKQRGNSPLYKMRRLAPVGGNEDIAIYDSRGQRVVSGYAVDYVPVSSVKTIMSETHKLKNTNKTIAPKQMFTQLGHSENMDTMFSDLIEGSLNGTTKANKTISDYLINKDPALIEPVLENLNDISMDLLGHVLNVPGAEKLASRVLMKMIDKNSNYVRSMYDAGELSREEFVQFVEMEEIYKNPAKRQLNMDNGSMAMTTHANTNKYVDQVIKQYYYSRATNPKPGNGTKQRTQVWDRALTEKVDWDGAVGDVISAKGEHLPEGSVLKKIYGDKNPDRFVFFNEAGRHQKYTFSGSEMKLGKIWEDFTILMRSGKASEKVLTPYRKFFKTLNIRVPMSAASAAQTLYFGGFTGIKGQGVLLHPRVMILLDGADHDGDTATTFFGGREIHKKGLDSEWFKDFEKVEEEFYETDPNTKMRRLSNPKSDEMIMKYTLSDPKYMELMRSKWGLVDPGARYRAAEGAAQGRGVLGPTVAAKAQLLAAFDHLVGNKIDFIDIVEPNKKGAPAVRHVFSPKKDSLAKNNFIKEARAMLSFAFDPMNQGGLRSADYFFRAMFGQLFDHVGSFDVMTKENMAKPLGTIDTKHLRKLPVVSDMSHVNKLVWGRDANGRKFPFRQLRRLLKHSYRNIQGKEFNSFYSKLGNVVQESNLDVDILSKFNMKRLESSIEKYNISVGAVRDKDGKRIKGANKNSNELRAITGYDSSKINFEPGSPIRKLLESNIWHDSVYEKYLSAIDPKDKLYEEPFTMQYVDTKVKAKDRKYKPRRVTLKDHILSKEGLLGYERKLRNPRERAKALDSAERQARDWLGQVVSDMASLDSIKTEFWRFKNEAQRNIDIKNSEFAPVIQKLMLKADEIKGLAYTKNAHDIDPNAKRFSRSEIDDMIGGFLESTFPNNKMTKARKHMRNIFDQIMLGTLMHKKTAEELGLLKDGRHYKTQHTRVGFQSASISDESLQKHVNNYRKRFAEVIPEVKPYEEKKAIVQSSEVTDLKSIVESKPIVRQQLSEPGKVIQEKNLSPEQKTYMNDVMYREIIGGVEDMSTIPKDIKKVVSYVVEKLNKFNPESHPWEKGNNLNDFIRSTVGKDLNKLDYTDIRYLKNWFTDLEIKNGFIHKGKTPDFSEGVPLSKWHYIFFPKAVGENLMKAGFELKSQVTAWQSKQGTVIGKALQPTNVISDIQKIAEATGNRKRRAFEVLSKKFSDDIYNLSANNPEFENFWSIAALEMEIANGGLTYQVKDLINPREIYGRKKTYLDRFRKVAKDTNWLKTKHETYRVGGKGETMTGREVVDSIKGVIRRYTDIGGKWITGDSENNLLSQFLERDTTKAKWKGKYPLKLHVDGTPMVNFKIRGDKKSSYYQWALDNLNTAVEGGMELGFDGMSVITRSMQMQQINANLERLNKAKTQATTKTEAGVINEKIKELYGEIRNMQKYKIKPTALRARQFYYPHIKADARMAASDLLARYKDIDLSSLSSSEKDIVKKSLATEYHMSVNGVYSPVEMDVILRSKSLGKILGEIAVEKNSSEVAGNWFRAQYKFGNAQRREHHIAGWDLSSDAFVNSYMKGMIDKYFSSQAQILSAAKIGEFKHFGMNGWDKGISAGWTNYLNAFTQQVLGNPVNIADEVANDPKMKMNGVFSQWRDNHVAKVMQKVAEKLKLKKITIKGLNEVSANDVVKWANAEARYQLATLLAHPKSSLNNIFGGTMHTVESVGLGNFLKAKNLSHITAAISPKLKTWEDVNSWLKELGIQEEFLRSELNFNPAFKGVRMKKAGTEIFNLLMSGKVKELPAVLKKHKVTEGMLEKAGWFMRNPEKMLRRDAFLAHYLQALENLGGSVDDPLKNPYLIEIAKRGVQATQFLYSAPFRPMFSNTALGKVVTRFQLWAWNSVRFRNDVIREAKLRDFRQGTPEFDRFKRMAMIDMFVLAMGNAFTYSLFETALPQPYAWAQDIGDFLFGDTEERERAFYGAYPGVFAPLQMATPPSMRMVGPTINALYENDWSKLANYHVWTMFPFGRIGRDMVGIYKNPGMMIEKTTGLPYRKIPRYKNELAKTNPKRHHAFGIGYNKKMPKNKWLDERIDKIKEKEKEKSIE
jgi:hypothetical protein